MASRAGEFLRGPRPNLNLELKLASTLSFAAVYLDTFIRGAEIRLPTRETNGQRFARGLPPLPPIRRSPTETAKHRQVSQPPGPSYTTGRLEVRWAANNTRVGYVANDPNLGPIGLNLDSAPNPADLDLTVEFSGSKILAQDPEFDAPYYIGGYGASPLLPQRLSTIEFINVHAGHAAIWTLDSTSGALNATWTNPDNTTVRPTLIYDPGLNALNFTSNPNGLYNFYFQVPVTIFLSK
ncbi:hypothetical protein BJY52DRAFT_1190941 [Lactarius psammicola]|nr:hypothetical protein BJY52DRAFT_1190941 [Lactarius psammicola]